MYLIPAVGPVRGVDEQGDDLGLGQQGSGSPRGLLRGEIVSTFLKQEVRAYIRGHREKLHVPEAKEAQQSQRICKYTHINPQSTPHMQDTQHRYCTTQSSAVEIDSVLTHFLQSHTQLLKSQSYSLLSLFPQ